MGWTSTLGTYLSRYFSFQWSLEYKNEEWKVVSCHFVVFFFFYHLCWSSISYTEQKRKRDHFPSVSCPGYSRHPLKEKKQRFFVQTASLDDPHPPEHFKILIPFIHSLLLIIIRVAGGLESIPATKGREVGYALWTDRLSVAGPL